MSLLTYEQARTYAPLIKLKVGEVFAADAGKLMVPASGIGWKLDIPPGQVSVTQNFTVLQAPARPENFQWNWHVNYVYEEDVAPLLPKSTTLVFTAWHDNTESEPQQPGLASVGRIRGPYGR